MGKQQKPFKPGRGYTRKDWHAVQSPELTAGQMAKAKPFAEVFPDLAASIHKASNNPEWTREDFAKARSFTIDRPRPEPGLVSSSRWPRRETWARSASDRPRPSSSTTMRSFGPSSAAPARNAAAARGAPGCSTLTSTNTLERAHLQAL